MHRGGDRWNVKKNKTIETNAKIHEQGERGWVCKIETIYRGSKKKGVNG